MLRPCGSSPTPTPACHSPHSRRCRRRWAAAPSPRAVCWCWRTAPPLAASRRYSAQVSLTFGSLCSRLFIRDGTTASRRAIRCQWVVFRAGVLFASVPSCSILLVVSAAWARRQPPALPWAAQFVFPSRSWLLANTLPAPPLCPCLHAVMSPFYALRYAGQQPMPSSLAPGAAVYSVDRCALAGLCLMVPRVVGVARQCGCCVAS